MTEYIYKYPSGVYLKVVGNFPGFFSAKLKVIRPIWKMHNNIYILYMYSCYAEGFFPSLQISTSLCFSSPPRSRGIWVVTQNR